MPCQVRLQQFEGPLDLLLQLIEKEKLDITEITLSNVADQYLEFLNTSSDISPANLAEFLFVASKLILIKSKALLPVLEFTEEEEEDIEDLKLRLEEYRRFKKAARKLSQLYYNAKGMHSREGYAGFHQVFCPPEGFKREDLSSSLFSLIDSFPTPEKLVEEVMESVVSIEERIEDIRQSLVQRTEDSFQNLTAKSEKKVDVIVTFLAMLELVKQKIIDVNQEKRFSDITIKSITTDGEI